MEYPCVYSTYNSHYKVRVSPHASNMDALKVTAAFLVFSLLLQDDVGSRVHFLHSFDSGCYHHITELK